MNRSARCITLLTEYEMDFPGFSRLKKIVDSDHEYKFPHLNVLFKQEMGYVFQTFRSFVTLLNVVIIISNPHMLLVCRTKMNL